jgi:hypothetical protein
MAKKANLVDNKQIILEGEFETIEDVKSEEVDNNELDNKIGESLDALEGHINELRRKAKKEWTNGFLSGYGSAIAGVVLGTVIIKQIGKKTKTELRF